MTNRDIFTQAAEAADTATTAKFGFDGKYPSTETPAGDYWKLVYEATAAHLMKHINGVY